MTQTTADVVVIGGGLGGLITAARVKRNGRSVVVLEQGSSVGGLARSPELGGAPVNLGPHALYLGGPAEAALKELGLELRGFIPGAAGYFEIDGALVAMPTTALGFLTASWLTWRERVELGLAMREVLATNPDGAWSEWLARRRSDTVRRFFASLARVSTYTNAPELIATGLVFAQLRSVLDPRARGVLYLTGGWQALVDALQVDVRCNARVTSLEGTKVTLENGEIITANEVALAVPLQVAAKLSRDAALIERAKNAVPVRAACLDLVLKKVPKPERRLVLGFDQPTYFSVHSAPDVMENVKVHVAWYLAPGEEIDVTTLEAFVDRVQPGWRDEVVARRYFPHLRVMEDVARETTTQLAAPVHVISAVATNRFLFDGVVASGDALCRPRVLGRTSP